MIAINKHNSKLKIWSVEMPKAQYLKPLYAMLKKEPTAQIAHLVFADTKANAEKTKRGVFRKRPTRN